MEDFHWYTVCSGKIIETDRMTHQTSASKHAPVVYSKRIVIESGLCLKVGGLELVGTGETVVHCAPHCYLSVVTQDKELDLLINL